MVEITLSVEDITNGTWNHAPNTVTGEYTALRSAAVRTSQVLLINL